MKFFTKTKPANTPHTGFTALFAVIFTFLSLTAFPQAGQKFASGGNSLSAGEFLGTINNYPIIIKTNNTQKAVFTTTGWFGLGITAPTCMFDVFGDGKINNFNVLSDLIVGYSLSVKKIFSPTGTVDFDGSSIFTSGKIKGYSISLTSTSSHITSATGTVDFDGNNISTTGTISANNLNANNFTNPVFAGSGKGIVTFDNNGTFQKLNFNNNPNSVLFGDGTFADLPASGWSINGNDMYSIPSGFIGIGTSLPIEKLDVDGNANIRGTLYVQNGVIIGQRVNTQKVFTDSLKSGKVVADKMTSDSIVSVNLKTDFINTKSAKVNNINIDGNNSRISSTVGLISFAGNHISEVGTVTCANLNVNNGITVNGVITSATGTVDFDGNNIQTTANITSTNLMIIGNGSFSNLSSNNFQNPLFAGVSNGLILSDVNGSFQKLNFDGNQSSYLRGDGTFSTLPELDLGDTIHAKVIIGDFINATKSIQLDGSITAGSRGVGNIGLYSIVVGGTMPSLGFPNAPIASGAMSVSFGAGNESSNIGSMSFGVGNISSGVYAVAFGGANVCSDTLSFAFGAQNTCSSMGSFAFGNKNSVSGKNSIAIGKSNKVEANNSAIIGGFGNTLNSDAINSAIIGGTGITATQQNTVYVPNLVSAGNVGIGVDVPIEKLDVNGNANIRGYLYVQDGVIIGRRIDGQRVNSDTIDVKKLAIKYATTDSLTSLKLETENLAVSQKLTTNEVEAKTMSVEKVTADTLKTENMTLLLMQADSITAQKMTLDKLAISEINATGPITSRDINIGEKGKFGNNIIIDGLTNNITTPGNITAGSITAGTMNISKITVDSSVVNSMHVVDTLKIGNGTIYLTSAVTGEGTENEIFTKESPLLIQSSGYSQNTIINADVLGNVGIGTDHPDAKLDIDGTLRIRGNNAANNFVLTTDEEGNATWKQNVNITGIGVTGSYPDYQINSLWSLNGGNIYNNNSGVNVGIGTDNPLKTLHVKSEYSGTDIPPEGVPGSMRLENVVTGGTSSSWDFEPMAGNLGFQNSLLIKASTSSQPILSLLEESGNVGIGTNVPTEKLEVNGNIKTTGNFTTGNISAVNITAENLTLNNPEFNDLHVINKCVFGDNLVADGITHQIRTQGGVPLLLQSSVGSTNTIINYNNTGNVGIGTNDPLKKLHVKTYEDNTGGGTPDPMEDHTGSIRIEHQFGVFAPSIWDLEPIVNGSGATRFSIGIPTRTDMFTIKSNGNVGIGTTNPNEKLEVNGYIKATGYKFSDGTPLNNFWTQNGENIYNSTTGNVGIGTSNPITQFQIGNGDSKICMGDGFTVSDQYGDYYHASFIGFNAGRTNIQVTDNR